MGFTQNIDLILSKIQLEKEQKREEKEQKRIKKEQLKEYERDLKKSLLTDLQYEFTKEFEKVGSQAVYTFYNIQNQNNIINLLRIQYTRKRIFGK